MAWRVSAASNGERRKTAAVRGGARAGWDHRRTGLQRQLALSVGLGRPSSRECMAPERGQFGEWPAWIWLPCLPAAVERRLPSFDRVFGLQGELADLIGLGFGESLYSGGLGELVFVLAGDLAVGRDPQIEEVVLGVDVEGIALVRTLQGLMYQPRCWPCMSWKYKIDHGALVGATRKTPGPCQAPEVCTRSPLIRQLTTTVAPKGGVELGSPSPLGQLPVPCWRYRPVRAAAMK